MTQDEIIKMAQEAGFDEHHAQFDLRIERFAKLVAQAERKSCLEKQEPVAWLITDEAINSIQVASIQRLIDRLKHAHHTDLRVRINGHDEWFEADWIKHLKRANPQPKPKREPVIDKSAAIRIATALGWEPKREPVKIVQYNCVCGKQMKFESVSGVVAPKREWVGLTDEEIQTVVNKVASGEYQYSDTFARAIEAKLKEKNT